MWETIQSGGPMMIPLILSAVLAIAYSIERALVLNRMPTADEAKAQLDDLEEALARGGQDAAVTRCNEGKAARIHHDFKRHQHEHHVSSNQNAREAHTEQGHGQHKYMFKRYREGEIHTSSRRSDR